MNKQKAFTLLEVLIAMTIFLGSMIVLANAWSKAFVRVKKTQINFEISVLLERKMTELDRLYNGKPISEIKDEDSGDFGDEYPAYAWEMKSKKFEFPDIASTMTAQDGGVDPLTQTIVRQLTDQLSKSIKEVTVTILYKEKKQVLKNSVTTYYVDFDKDMNFGIP